MARKGATRKSDPGRRPGTPAVAASEKSTSRLEWALLVALALSAALSATILYVHAQLAANGGAYTSFCNVNTRINCDVVLTSSYRSLLGMPVALWALLTYVALAVLVLIRRRTDGEVRSRATLLMVALAVWSLVFSLYMAALAAFAIGAVCLLCTGLYVLNGVIAVLGWRLARAAAPPACPVLTQRRVAVGAVAMVAALAILGGAQLTSSSAAVPPHFTAADVRTQKPDFYDWYTSRRVADALPAAEHARGPADAAITIVEFSDFECAFCAKAFRDLRDVERQHGAGLRVVFHHFPLDPECNPQVPTRVHRAACQAAIAAECAARFGRFWEYHDRLFENQQRLGRDDLVATAVDLGIERVAFSACLTDPEARGRVAADAAAGARLGVNSTPTLVINGRIVEGALDRNAYEWVIAMERRD
jgi:protein-disulfide isomerase